MNSIQKRRLTFVIILSICSALAFFLVLLALKQNVNLFFTPTQLLQERVKTNQRIRIGGVVKKGSIVRTEGLKIRFVVTDLKAETVVYYTGILPDLFKEGQGVVAQGFLSDHTVFMADEILAKHDENYMPPEVANSLKK